MTTKYLALELDGCEYRSEMNEDLRIQAKENGLVVVYGASDDLMIFNGAIDDEVGVYEGGSYRVTKKHNVRKKKKLSKNNIEAVWCPKSFDASWQIKTLIPHETFTVMDDGDLYCVGIVFSINDLQF